MAATYSESRSRGRSDLNTLVECEYIEIRIPFRDIGKYIEQNKKDTLFGCLPTKHDTYLFIIECPGATITMTVITKK